MDLTGPQFEQVKQALLAAYTKASLRDTVRGRLNVELDKVAGGENDTAIFSNLVRWAERESRIPDLIDAAVADNPTNEELQKLKQAAEGWHLLAPQGAGEPEPYKGLDFFGVDDAILFFGREDLTRDLVNCLKDNPFLAVVGASGSGKSSVVRAGVVAALQDSALSPSRRNSAPICPRSVLASASARIRSLYSALNFRRVAFSVTAGSGNLLTPRYAWYIAPVPVPILP